MRKTTWKSTFPTIEAEGFDKLSGGCFGFRNHRHGCMLIYHDSGYRTYEEMI